MEETVCTSWYGFITIYTTRAKHTNWRLMSRHVMCLVIGCMATEKNVFGNIHGVATLNEKGILHVTCRVISSKVQHSKHVLVVIYLWSLVECEAHSSKDVNDFILYQRQWMTCTKADRVGGTCQINIVTLCLTCLKLLFEVINLVLCDLFEFIDFHANCLLLVSCYIAKLAHQRIDFTFLT